MPGVRVPIAGLESFPQHGFIAEGWSGPLGASSSGTLTLTGNSRAYLYQNYWTGAGSYLRVDLRGKTMRFTADLSRVPCGVNVRAAQGKRLPTRVRSKDEAARATSPHRTALSPVPARVCAVACSFVHLRV